MKRQKYSSKHASLAMMAKRFEEMEIWAIVCREVKIEQKKVKHEAMDKLLDCAINMMMGGRGLVEINTRLRTDVGVQRAFGRTSCAEQSTVSDTLNACGEREVKAMRTAVKAILQKHGKALRQGGRGWLILDVDTMGMVCGKQCEGAEKGYFSGKRNRRGRQLGRVCASAYEEILVERLYPGRRQLEGSLMELIDETEDVLGRDEKRPENKVFRVDAGGGSDANINAILGRGYHVLTKMHSGARAKKMAELVQEWHPISGDPNRWVGWTTSPHCYIRPTRQLILKSRDQSGHEKHAALVTTMSDSQLSECFGLNDQPNTPWLFLHAYDLRGGGIESQNRSDQQGLGLAHRTMRSFHAQEMLVLLAQLVHLFLVWMRDELATRHPRFAAFGLKRFVRDILAIDGFIRIDSNNAVSRVTLNPNHPFSAAISTTWNRLLC